MSAKKQNPIYSDVALEFVTVAAEYCRYLEQSQGCPRVEFEHTMLRLLPLLYLKIQLLPAVETEGDFLPDDQVTEDDYNWVRSLVRDIYAEEDEYECLAWDPDTQTEESRWKSISEDMADMYQALRNFTAAYQQRVEACMQDALWGVKENFELYWGNCLVDVLRRMHQLSLRENREDK